MAIECPKCGLKTPRFLQYCPNCSFALWPSGPHASAAFQAWRKADPARARARRYDLELPAEEEAPVIDYERRARELGIHVSAPTNYPIVISLGFLLLALAAIPLPNVAARIALVAIGGVLFLIGVIGWVVIEDTRMFPQGDGAGHDGHSNSNRRGDSH
jgi:hypothetical protein